MYVFKENSEINNLMIAHNLLLIAVFIKGIINVINKTKSVLLIKGCEQAYNRNEAIKGVSVRINSIFS